MHVEEGEVCIGMKVKHLLFLRPHTRHCTSAILYLVSRIINQNKRCHRAARGGCRKNDEVILSCGFTLSRADADKATCSHNEFQFHCITSSVVVWASYEYRPASVECGRGSRGGSYIAVLTKL